MAKIFWDLQAELDGMGWDGMGASLGFTKVTTYISRLVAHHRCTGYYLQLVQNGVNNNSHDKRIFDYPIAVKVINHFWDEIMKMFKVV